MLRRRKARGTKYVTSLLYEEFYLFDIFSFSVLFVSVFIIWFRDIHVHCFFFRQFNVRKVFYNSRNNDSELIY